VDALQWTAEQVGAFFGALFDVLRKLPPIALILESNRELPLPKVVDVRVFRRRLTGLTPADGSGLLRHILRRSGTSEELISDGQGRSISGLLDGHPALLVMAAGVSAQAGAEELIADLKGRGRFYRSLVSALMRNAKFSDSEQKCLAGLVQCRKAIPTRDLDYLLRGEMVDTAVTGLVSAGFAERPELDLAIAASVLREANLDSLRLERGEAARFHGALSRHFSTLAKRSRGEGFLAAAIESNHHATLAGQKPPFPTNGLRDDLVGAARHLCRQGEVGQAIDLLESLTKVPGFVREDALALLCSAYIDVRRLHDAEVVADGLVGRNRSYFSLYVEISEAAQRAGHRPQAESALQKAEALAPSDYRVLMQRGRLMERDKPWESLRLYQRAVDVTIRDAQPFFFLARLLRRLDRPEDALATIDGAREFANEGNGRRLGAWVESVLLQEEMYCYILLDDDERAADVARTIQENRSTPPEARLRAAYALAVRSPDPAAVFEKTLKDMSDGPKGPRRSDIAILRSRLFERLDDLDRAEAELREAVRLDPRSIEPLDRLRRLLWRRIGSLRRAGAEPAARVLAQEVLDLVRSIVSIDREHKGANETRENLYIEFELQVSK